MQKDKRGLASASESTRRRVASMGGIAAHKMGKAHKFTSEEASIAGKKGGRTHSREHMATIGRKGGLASRKTR